MRRAFVVAVAVAVAVACGGADPPRAVYVPPEPADASVAAEAPRDASAAVASEPEPEAEPDLALGVDPALPHPVSLALGFAALRRHSELSRLGPVLEKIPVGAEATTAGLDVLRDLDSVVTYGPSLARTDRSVTLVRYNVTDKVMDAVVAKAAARLATPPQGRIDAGIPAKFGFGDGAARVFARPRPQLLAVLPPRLAQAGIAELMKSPPAAPAANEAFRLRVRQPKRVFSIPGLPLPEALEELRFWGVPTAGGGADVYVEGDCATEDAAKELAASWSDAVKRANTTIVRMVTRGVFSNVTFSSDKRTVSSHVALKAEQIHALVELGAAWVGAKLPSNRDGGP